jgi:hypothetical protein
MIYVLQNVLQNVLQVLQNDFCVTFPETIKLTIIFVLWQPRKS